MNTFESVPRLPLGLASKVEHARLIYVAITNVDLPAPIPIICLTSPRESATGRMKRMMRTGGDAPGQRTRHSANTQVMTQATSGDSDGLIEPLGRRRTIGGRHMHKRRVGISGSEQQRHLLEPAIQFFLLVLRDALQASIVAGRCELGRFLKLCLHRRGANRLVYQA